jgi:acyl carrier protein
MKTTRIVRNAIAAFLDRPIDHIVPDRPLRELVADSFELVELVIDLQDQFGLALSQSDFDGVSTVADLIDVLVFHLERQAAPDAA